MVSYYLLSSYIAGSDGSSTTALLNCAKGVGFVTMLEYGFKVDKKGYVEAFVIAGFIWCSVNYASYLIYRDVLGGMQSGYLEFGKNYVTSQHWFFFTHDNGSLFFYLPVAAAAFYHSFKYNRKWLMLSYGFAFLVELMYIDLESTTAMVAMGLFLASVLLLYFKKCMPIFRLIKGRNAIYLGLAIASLVVVFGLLGNMTGAVGALGKNGTFGSRLVIWNRSIDWISRSLWFGSGFESTALAVMKLTYNHCHNIVVQLLYSGGVLSFILYLSSHLSCMPSTKNGMGDFRWGSEHWVVSVAIIAYFVAASFDWYAYFVLPALIFYLFVETSNGSRGGAQE